MLSATTNLNATAVRSSVSTMLIRSAMSSSGSANAVNLWVKVMCTRVKRCTTALDCAVMALKHNTHTHDVDRSRQIDEERERKRERKRKRKRKRERERERERASYPSMDSIVMTTITFVM